MPKLIKCPLCDEPAIERALVDSDDRIYARWLVCACGYDSRNGPKPAPLTDSQGKT